MFDDSPDQELYQLWINVPSYHKLQSPDVRLLGADECPTISSTITDESSETIVLAGSYQNQQSKAPIMSDMSILHVRVQPNGTWKYTLPTSFETVILYIRQGSLEIAGTTVSVHHTAYLEAAGGDELVIVSNSKEGVDFLLLAGRPLLEPVAAQGSMVMNSAGEINDAYRDYQAGFMGQPWDHKLTNDEWKAHVQKYPCRYQYTDTKK
jgi:redox-sensitive bicupin YhaK (pirin superfamily)